jgi:hypothetical protein
LIERTAPNALFYNITLSGLEIPLQAPTVHIECLECSDAATGDVSFYSIVSINLHAILKFS